MKKTTKPVKKAAKKTPHLPKEIMVISPGEGRIVTPQNPLVINYAPAILESVEIQGGQIYTLMAGKVEITKLTKTS